MIPRIRRLAGDLARRLPSSVGMEDLIQTGVEGALTAWRRARDDRAPGFGAYLARRARGAILDDLRARDRLSRGERRKARELEEARRALAARLGREPDPSELRTETGVGESVQEEIARRVGGARDVELSVDVGADDTPDALAALLAGERRARLLAAVARLRPRQRQVLCLRYGAELPVADIGRRLGISDGRVSQIHNEALAVLRAMLADA